MKLAVILPLVLGLGSAVTIVIYVCLSYNKGGNLLEMSRHKGLTKLVHLLEKAGAQNVIPKKGSYTMFAPTDEAFSALDTAIMNTLMDDEDLLRKSLLNHIIPGRVYSHDLVSQWQPASQEEVPMFKINTIPHKGKPLQVSNVTVLVADIEANNGIIHIIDKVLLQPEVLQKTKPKPKQPKSLMEVARDTGLTTLVDLVAKAGLEHIFTEKGLFTLFAPTNDAFAALTMADLSTLKDNDLLKDILLHHLVIGEVHLSELNNGSLLSTVNGTFHIIHQVEGKNNIQVTVDNSAQVMVPNLNASNGVLHIINEVLFIPKQNVHEVLLRDPENKFYTLMIMAYIIGLEETLLSPDPYTIFAPTNEAFELFTENDVSRLLQYNVEVLRRLFLRHVVAGIFSSTQLSGQLITINNSSLRVEEISNGDLVVASASGSATIIETDMVARNSIIHVIDHVL